MKIKSLLLILVMFCSISIYAHAADTSRQYELSLSSNGKQEIQVNTGDIITITAILTRTDKAETAPIYGFQNEIRYDDQFIQIIDSMTVTTNNINTNDIGLVDGDRAFYVNFLSFDRNTHWQPETMLVNFQAKILAEKGATKLKNENVIISVEDGSGTYQYTVKDLLIIVTSECTVKFDSNGGTEVPDLTVHIGDLITKPDNPEREGYIFMGWYTDISMKNEWDFETDTVDSNITLYAKWESEYNTVITPVVPDDTTPTPPIAMVLGGSSIAIIAIFIALSRKTITYMVNGKEYVKVKVKKNSKFIPPANPTSENLTFDGWYKDSNCTEKVDIENDTIKQSTKLFAKFK